MVVQPSQPDRPRLIALEQHVINLDKVTHAYWSGLEMAVIFENGSRLRLAGKDAHLADLLLRSLSWNPTLEMRDQVREYFLNTPNDGSR